MAASRMGQHYAEYVAIRQFDYAAEDVSYQESDGTTVNLKAVVLRDPTPELDRRDGDGMYEVHRATLSVFAFVDAVCGGLVLDTADKISAFRGKNFSLSLIEGGPMLSDWIVKTVSPSACGQWDIGVVREKRTEVGKTRRTG